MKAGNASIMAAAAVVVALCLLFSWVYLDDGDGGAEFRSEQVGDVMVWDYHIVYVDGQEEDFACTQTLVAVMGETHIYLNEYDDGRTSYSQDDGITDDMELVGTETVTLEGLGEYECDVYRISHDDGDTDTLWYHGDACLKAVFEIDGTVQTSVLRSATTTGDAPEYGVCGVDDTVEVGDFSAFGCYIMDEGNDFDLEALMSFTYEVTSVEDGIVTYDYVSTEGVLREYTTSVTDFATFDDDSYALEGQAVIDTIYGERLCDVYVKDDTGMTMLVGAGDDVIYAMVVYEGEAAFYYALEYSTEVYGDHPYDTDLPQDGSFETVGDYYTVIIQVNEADGTKWSGIYAQLKVGEIDGQGYIQREWFGYTPDDPVAGTLFSTGEDDGPVGTVVVNTVYGAIECDIITFVFESGTVMTGAYYGGYPIWENYEYTDGVSATYTYYYNSVVAGGADYGSCVQEIPEAGDTMDLVYVYPDGEYYEIEQTILSVEDGMIVIEQEGTEYEYPLDLFIDGFDRDGATYRGQALVATLYGYRVCDVWSDDGGIYLLGADDGVNYISAYAGGYVVYFSSDDFIFEA